MTDSELVAEYGGYSDQQLQEFIEQGIPDWQRQCFERLIAIRQNTEGAPSTARRNRQALVSLICWVMGIILLFISAHAVSVIATLAAFIAIVIAMVISFFQFFRGIRHQVGWLRLAFDLSSVVCAVIFLPLIGLQFVHTAVSSTLATTATGTMATAPPSHQVSPYDNFLKEARALDPDFDKPSTNADSGYLQRLQSNPDAFVELPDASKAADPALNEALKRKYPAESYAPDYRQFGQRPPPNP